MSCEPRKGRFSGHHLFGDAVCLGSVKQKGQSVRMPPYLYGLMEQGRFHALYWKRPCIHVHLLHNIISDPDLSQSPGALGGLSISLAFSCYLEIALGGTDRQVHTESYTSGRTGGLFHNVVGPKGW